MYFMTWILIFLKFEGWNFNFNRSEFLNDFHEPWLDKIMIAKTFLLHNRYQWNYLDIVLQKNSENL